jgi:UDP-2,4-diacetamido-2,4,6-trideoxy-beta-L-altropyranose hydrolase
MFVIFRVDSSNAIGSGHVMRCLTLADALREKGCTCQFVCRNHLGKLSALIQEKGYRVTLLPLQEFQVEAYPRHVAWVGADWRTDAKETGALIATLETPPDWLVVDHYGLDARWETSLRPGVGRIFVMDDLVDRQHDCDLLLDQNLVANRASRYVGKVPKHAGLMLGPEYALLQPQYAG